MSLHYLIDGYNLIYALREIPPGTLEAKRQALLQRLLAERPHGRNALTVIFDSREGGGQRSRQGEATIFFTAGETADDWIIRHVRTERNARILRVVTDDQGLCRMIRGTGAQSMGTIEFWAQGTPASRQQVAQEPQVDTDSITEEFKKKWM